MIRIVVLIAAIAAAACFDSPTGPDVAAGTPFELRAGAASVLPDGTRLTFRDVRDDSRCPMDVMCVWAGDAIVAIALTPPKGLSESRDLHVQPSASRIAYAGYTIALTALAPYPRATQPIPAADYIATFVVSVR
jgi:hypothetical protein